VKRNSSSTRQAIINAASDAFIQLGYDGAGLRDIARGAGVTAMMIGRYFGSKEGLFREVVEINFAKKSIVSDSILQSQDPKIISAALVEGLLLKTSPEVHMQDGFSLLLKSASNPKALEILSEKILEHFEKPLSKSIKGENKSERIALVLALIAGIHILRQSVQIQSFKKSHPESITTLVEAVVFKLLQD
jgi:AcrR family transcriptional regulator